MKRIKVLLAVDVDAVCGWLGSFGGAESPQAISRGMFAGEVGVPRMLKLLDDFSIPSTWFTPGHSIETFPSQIRNVVAAGHEIGVHGYSHEKPASLSEEQEIRVMEKAFGLVADISGRDPVGYSAPWWDPSERTISLLQKYGFLYDHSLMHRDFEMYRVRTGDQWTPIDYSQDADTWMKPLIRGTETSIVEIPANWYLDDLPPLMFIPSFENSHGWVNPRDIGQQWKDQFDWVYEEMEDAVFPITIHPDVGGRPQVLMMLKSFLQHVQDHDDVEFCTFESAARYYLSKNPADQAVIL